jgi:tetraacyldisaccharide 4'-kinase
MNLHPVLRALLWPFSILFSGVVRVRAWLYRNRILPQKRLPGVVISVGNLTVGGTGKTPMVIWLAEKSARAGHNVGVLTRGYRSQELSGVATQSAAERKTLPGAFSDEVWLIWRRLGEQIKLGVGPDRFAWGRRLAQEGVDWFILDDGFQHLRLARDADIVMVDATDPISGGLLLPAGRLREPRSALARAEVIVITRSDRSPELERELRGLTGAPIFYARVEPDGIFHAASLMIGPEMRDWHNRAFFAFCAIGNGAAFFEDLARWSIRSVGHLAFPDHHAFQASDVEEIERQAKKAGAEALICTEKDVFNFRQLQNWSLPVYYCQIRQELTDPEGFWQAVLTAVTLKRQPKSE